MMKTASLDDLLASVEAARQELHPSLDAKFTRDALQVASEHVDDQEGARLGFRRLVEDLEKRIREGA